MKTDPVADMLTRIRNGLRNKSKTVRIPLSKFKVTIAEVLEREGYLLGHRVFESKPEDGVGPQGWLEVDLKYGEEGEQVICSIRRVSRPGRRVYSSPQALRPIQSGLGILVLSTSRGTMSDREAKLAGVGGEVLAEVY